jgi:hypothetical protein
MSQFLDWKRRADALLSKQYCITLEDVGADEKELRRFHWNGDAPDEFVAWFANKYELTSAKSVGLTPNPDPS